MFLMKNENLFNYVFKPITDPLLEKIVETQQISRDLENNINAKNINEKEFEKKEKEFTITFNILTLKYKQTELEKKFSSYIEPYSLLIVEVVLSILSFLLIYIYFPKEKFTSVIMGIIISIRIILILILIPFYHTVFHGWISRHVIASIYLLSPLIIILIQIPHHDQLTVQVFVVFISTYLTLGTFLSHSIKVLLAVLSISIYLPLIIIKPIFSSLFELNN